jgi:hypothetical protein
MADRVTFTSRIPRAEIAPRMHAADAVLVYSRHAYGEGLPGTIYLGLASRTPLVVSDHPMFVAYLRDGEDVLVAPEHAPAALAARLRGYSMKANSTPVCPATAARPLTGSRIPSCGASSSNAGFGTRPKTAPGSTRRPC